MPNSKWRIRPTTDQAKESLFNILINRTTIEQAEVLDLFAGIGNITYEFASRGAHVVCVEKFGAAVGYIKKNISTFGLEQQVNIQKADVFKFLENHHKQYDIIFADPPYKLPLQTQLINLIVDQQILRPEGWLVIEHDSSNNFEPHPCFVEKRKYGQSFFSFFQSPSLDE